MCMFRRLFSAVMSLLIALGAVGALGVGSAAAGVRYGDVNGDGEINSGDALVILRHSVAAEVLDSAEFERADVTGDKTVNSSDALAVLRYSVGLITKFDVEKETVLPSDKNEVLTLYKEAVKKARQDKPGYTMTSEISTKNIDVDLGGLGLLVPASEKARLLEEMKSEYAESDKTTVKPRKGSDNSVKNMLPLCTVSNASKLKDVSLSKTAEGNYKISIKFNDEKNPSNTSPIVSTLGVPGVDDIKASFANAGDEEIQIKVSKLNVEYKNASLTCVIDPDSGEIISLDFSVDSETDVSISTLGLIVSMDMTQLTTGVYKDFDY